MCAVDVLRMCWPPVLAVWVCGGVRACLWWWVSRE
jgi:hypothetical protein